MAARSEYMREYYQDNRGNLLEKAKERQRSKRRCIFYMGNITGFVNKNNFCKFTLYESCRPDCCPWYKSRRMIEDSYEKAAARHYRITGMNDYYQRGYAPLHKEAEEDE